MSRPRDAPLDLRAVEEFFDGCDEWNRTQAKAIESGDADPAASGYAVEYGRALLAHVRALRAALQRVVDGGSPPWQYDELRAVLAQASDGEGP